MMDKFLKKLVDFIYGTKSKRREVETQFNEKVLAADASKGIITNQDNVKRGTNWIVSQRAVILLTEKRILCGKWNIPIDDISKADLVKIKSILGGGQVLKIKTNQNVDYQFGMQNNDEWISQDVMRINVENGKVKTSLFSLVIRIIAIGLLAYWLYEKF